VGVGGEGFVGEAEQRRVGDMVGIGADVAVFAFEAMGLHPRLHKVELCRVVAIMPVDPREDMAAAVGGKVGRDHIVEAEPMGNRLDIKAVGGGCHDMPVPRRLFRGDAFA